MNGTESNFLSTRMGRTGLRSKTRWWGLCSFSSTTWIQKTLPYSIYDHSIYGLCLLFLFLIPTFIERENKEDSCVIKEALLMFTSIVISRDDPWIKFMMIVSFNMIYSRWIELLGVWYRQTDCYCVSYRANGIRRRKHKIPHLSSLYFRHATFSRTKRLYSCYIH